MPSRKAFPVHWSKTASLDLESIIEYLCAKDAAAAERVLEQIQAAASRLDLLPKRGRIVPELKRHGILIYRELVLPPWRVMYRVRERDVLVLAVIDARRDLEDLLLQRFLA